MKRKAEGDLYSSEHSSKRLQIDLPLDSSLYPAHTLVNSITQDNLDVNSILDDDHDSLVPLDTPDDVFSTPATTPRPRFPSDLKTHACPYPDCPKTFNRPARLEAHIRSHTNERPFACTHPGCDKTYIEEKHLRQHTKSSHNGERVHVCPVAGCGKAFFTGTRLRRHEAVHEGEERFRCRDFPPCVLTFRKRATLQRHVRMDHLGEKAFVCSADKARGLSQDQDGGSGTRCGQGFDTAAALRRHVDREHGEIKFWCNECSEKAREQGRPEGVGFTMLALLQAHVRDEHRNCMFCDFRCTSRSDMERHFEMHHSGQTVEERKILTCSWAGCDKKFTKRSNLTSHVKVAHEGFRFVCGEVDLSGVDGLSQWSGQEGCRKGFVTKANLEDHVRYVHLAQARPAKPPSAVTHTTKVEDSAKSTPKAKTTKPEAPVDVIDDLIGAADDTRRKIHCTVLGCVSKFIRPRDLRSHIRKHHGEQSSSCNTQETSDVCLLDDKQVGSVKAMEPVLSSSHFTMESMYLLQQQVQAMNSSATDYNGSALLDPLNLHDVTPLQDIGITDMDSTTTIQDTFSGGAGMEAADTWHADEVDKAQLAALVDLGPQAGDIDPMLRGLGS